MPNEKPMTIAWPAPSPEQIAQMAWLPLKELDAKTIFYFALSGLRRHLLELCFQQSTGEEIIADLHGWHTEI